MTMYFYLIRADNGLVKIGVTTIPQDRLATVYAQSPLKVHYEYCVQTDKAKQLEYDMACLYREKCHHADWFELAEADVEHIKSVAVGEPFRPTIKKDYPTMRLMVLCVACNRRSFAKKTGEFRCRYCGSHDYISNQAEALGTSLTETLTLAIDRMAQQELAQEAPMDERGNRKALPCPECGKDAHGKGFDGGTAYCEHCGQRLVINRHFDGIDEWLKPYWER